MQVVFDGKGFKAESIAAQQFNGKLVTDLNQQYKDIDVLIPAKDGSVKSVSVKDQLWSSEKFGGIQIETLTTNTRTGQTMPGCFYQNESDYYFWRIYTKQYGDTWLIVESSVMKQYVAENASHLKAWATKPATEAKNRSYNRRYDRTEGMVIQVADAVKLGKLIPVKETLQ